MTTLLNILKFPNPILKIKSEPVAEVTPEIINLMHQMLETMYANNGIGLAANQVGILKRLIVIDLQINNEKNPMFLINPEIIESSSELFEYNEGCLSFPELNAIVFRAKKIKVKYTNLEGVENIIEAEDLLSVCLQHEIDHLDGITFVDKLPRLKKDITLRKYKRSLKTSNNISR